MSECDTEVQRGEIPPEERTFHEETDDHSKMSGSGSADSGSGGTTGEFNRQSISESYDGGASGQRSDEDNSVLTDENASYQIMLDYGQQISIKDNVIEIHAVGSDETGEGSDQQYSSDHQLKSEFDGISTDGAIQAQQCDNYPVDTSRKLQYPDEHEDAERMSTDDDSKVSEDSLPHIMTFSSNPQDTSSDMEHAGQYSTVAGTSSTNTLSPSYAVPPSCPPSSMAPSYDCNFRRPSVPMSAPSDAQYQGDSHRMLRAPAYPRMPHVRTPHPMHMMYMPPGSRNMLPPPSQYYPSPGPIGHYPSNPQGYHSQGIPMMNDGLNSSGEEQHSSPEYPSVPNNTPSGMMDGTPHRPIIGPLDNKAPLFVPQLHSICTSVAAARQHHNAKERMRRARVKDACQLLRELVPGMTDKTDKATVFEFGTQYILFLKERIGKKYDREFLQKYSPY